MSSCRGRRASPIALSCVPRWPRDTVSCVERFSPTTRKRCSACSKASASRPAPMRQPPRSRSTGAAVTCRAPRRTSMPTSRGRPPALRCRSPRSARCRSSSTLTRRCGVVPWETSSPLCGRWGSRSPNWASPIDCRLASRVRSTGPRHRCRAIRRASSSPAFCSPVGRRRCRWPSPPNRFLGPTSR